ncbi:MAG: hypothetical protein LV479_13125 [Methylacidiphilales bacterium]|nr:hypothetical protein [Candidatus Methylacidiphilales bacterium]
MPIIAGMCLLLILLMPFCFLARVISALFSERSRKAIQQNKLFHVCWFLASMASFVLLFEALVAGGPSIKATQRAKTNATMEAIQTAIVAYQTEYGTSPPEDSNAELAKVLEGANPRRIAFISMLPRDSNAQGEILDAWGTPLRIKVTKITPLQIQSAGPDKVWNTKDDVTLPVGSP